MTDDQIRKLLRGGHDPDESLRRLQSGGRTQRPATVILAKTIKGYGLGEAGEGRNITHQQKKLNEKELREFRSRFDIPLQRRRNCRDALLPSAAGQPGNQILARTPQKAAAAFCRNGKSGRSRLRVPEAVDYRGILQRFGRPFECRPRWRFVRS